jgi:hypothetical protein
VISPGQFTIKSLKERKEFVTATFDHLSHDGACIQHILIRNFHALNIADDCSVN